MLRGFHQPVVNLSLSTLAVTKRSTMAAVAVSLSPLNASSHTTAVCFWQCKTSVNLSLFRLDFIVKQFCFQRWAKHLRCFIICVRHKSRCSALLKEAWCSDYTCRKTFSEQLVQHMDKTYRQVTKKNLYKWAEKYNKDAFIWATSGHLSMKMIWITHHALCIYLILIKLNTII